MKECPQDFFYDILSENQFISQVLRVKRSYKSAGCLVFLFIVFDVGTLQSFSRNIPASNKDLHVKFKTLYDTLKEKFSWEIPGVTPSLKDPNYSGYDTEDDEEEEGEYAPAIVEM